MYLCNLCVVEVQLRMYVSFAHYFCVCAVLSGMRHSQYKYILRSRMNCRRIHMVEYGVSGLGVQHGLLERDRERGEETNMQRESFFLDCFFCCLVCLHGPTRSRHVTLA